MNESFRLTSRMSNSKISNYACMDGIVGVQQKESNRKTHERDKTKIPSCELVAVANDCSNDDYFDEVWFMFSSATAFRTYTDNFQAHSHTWNYLSIAHRNANTHLSGLVIWSTFSFRPDIYIYVKRMFHSVSTIINIIVRVAYHIYILLGRIVNNKPCTSILCPI